MADLLVLKKRDSYKGYEGIPPAHHLCPGGLNATLKGFEFEGPLSVDPRLF
jgi:hypothetical protein